jgi:GR25 family glycosyltransferase involved in LPS biosynthesis
MHLVLTLQHRVHIGFLLLLMLWLQHKVARLFYFAARNVVVSVLILQAYLFHLANQAVGLLFLHNVTMTQLDLIEICCYRHHLPSIILVFTFSAMDWHIHFGFTTRQTVFQWNG